MFKTRITEMFGIEYPIIQGAMQWLARAELASAVSNAGGLGIISSAIFPTIKELRQEIRKMRGLTERPFAVNITLLPTFRPMNYEEYITAAIEEGANIIETAGRSPEPYMKLLKDAKVTVMHKCARVGDVKTAERLGVDAVTIIGFEAGGVPGMEDVTSLVRIPLAMDAVKIPIIAGGGIGDGRGLVAALALGAQGVQMGTRFVCSDECIAHPRYKEKILKARDRSTVVTGQSVGNAVRCLENKLTQQFLALEKAGASKEELDLFGQGRAYLGLIEGDIDGGSLVSGQIAGLVKEIKPVKVIMEEIVAEAEAIIGSLENFRGGTSCG